MDIEVVEVAEEEDAQVHQADVGRPLTSLNANTAEPLVVVFGFRKHISGFRYS